MSWISVKTPTVNGKVLVGYESAAEVFKKVMKNGLEDKVQVSAYVKGELVVELVGTTSTSKLEYDRTSLQNVFSSTKAVSSVVIAMLVDRKLLSYDTPIAKIWPEFAQEGKQDVTVRHLMMHESGLQKFSFSLEAANLQRDQLLHRDRKNDTIASTKMAAAKPKCPAGSKRAYHALTRGFLENEIVMRVDPKGRTIGEFLREEIAGPLGIQEEITLGDETKRAEKRIHPLVPHSYWTLLWEALRLTNRKLGWLDLGVYILLLNVSAAYLIMRLLFGPEYVQSSLIVSRGPKERYFGFIETYNHPLIRSSEIPSANAHATATALAKIASVMGNAGEAHGVKLMSKETAELAQSGWSKRYDSVVWSETNFCQGGWCVFDDPKFACDRQGSIGWFGLGGSAMMWHRELQVGFGYACTRLKADLSASNSAKVQNEILNCARRLQEQKK